MINIEYVDREFKLNHAQLSKWIVNSLKEEDKDLGFLTIVIGSDEWLLNKNIEFLNHDYYTDIITFDYTDEGVISGDLLISLDRVIDNAATNNVPRETEMNRVIIHGVLHLIGYDDKSPKDSELMRKKEDYYLTLL